ncbi:DUF2059 domain-containing protein [Mariniflexile sp. AS56]|uniref:DUF2059 domain-containing protein n=1 Tax=Mariniflexile sp. AS56 TaxID=3063957 RepID=UPI0026EB5C8B|nr:DUF2059 domain-containing protein [Mariniflexile sp. AS56]MDO7172175.1 DUF2059 domain-containing protein [Mariniflexile sp. AS56]
MKKLVLACMFLVAVATQAQETSQFKTETIEFIKLTGAGAAFDGAIAQIGFQVTEANKEAYTKEAMATLDGLYGKIADLYMEEFTQNEIKELVDFYHTDLGKKLAKKQLGLTQKAMTFGQSWGMEVSQIAQKYNE